MATDIEKRQEIKEAILEFMEANNIPISDFKMISGHRKDSKNHKHHGGIDISEALVGSRAMQNKLIKFMLSKGYRVVDERDGHSGLLSKRKKGLPKQSIHFDKKPYGSKLVKYFPSGSIENPKINEVVITKKQFDSYEKAMKKSPERYHRHRGIFGEGRVKGGKKIQSLESHEVFRHANKANKLKAAKQKIKNLVKSKGSYSKEEREAKALAYQDLLDAGGKSKFAEYWTKFLPKEEVEVKEKTVIKDSPLESHEVFRHFNREIDVPQDKNTEQKIENKIEGKGLLQDLVVPESHEVQRHPQVIPESHEVQRHPQQEVGPSGLSPAQTALDPTAEAKGIVPEKPLLTEKEQTRVDFEQKAYKGKYPDPNQNLLLKEGGEVKKYKTGELVEKEFYPGQEKQFQQNIGNVGVKESETVLGEKPLQPGGDFEALSGPKDPKPPVEASVQGDTVVLTKQEQVDDVDKMSVVELKDKLQETKEVVSEPNSDTVTLKTRPSQIQKSKKLKAELDKRKQWAEESSDAAIKVGIRETPGRMGKSQVDVTEDVKLTEEEADPKAFSVQDYIQQTLQRDDEARELMKSELAKAAEAENNIQKVEPMRFWNSMSTPAKIVAGIGMLIGGYYGTKSAAGTQAVMDVIDGAVSADISAQKLTRENQLVAAKEATRRAKAAVDKYKATATNPLHKAKLMELGLALDTKRAGIAKTQQLQALRQYVMNQARGGKLHLVPPALMRMVYPKEEMKRIDTLRENFEKERKDRKIAPTISAYRRLHNLIASDQKISGADDISIVFQFMKMLDPNSVVREGEFKTAEGAGPRAEYFARQWNRMWNGGRFVESDRKAFLQSALKMIKPAMDDEKDLQRKYVSMARRYGYPAAFIISPSVRYFDLPGTKDEAGIRKIMKEQGKTREEASDIHYQVRRKVKSSFYLP